VKQSVWGEPFFNAPKELGPYAYSTINIRKESIKKEPEVVRGFVRGMMKGLKFLYADQERRADMPRSSFRPWRWKISRATLDRSFNDEMWSKDGMISKAAWETGKAVGDGSRHAQDRCQL
jgi:NitT/TauT family transport system substrate-binding protein